MAVLKCFAPDEGRDDAMKIDAHQHFWKYTPAEYGWISDDMAVLRRDHLPAEFERLAAAVGMEGSIAVQARQSLAETEWLLALAAEYPFIKGVVGWVDLRSDRLDEQLAGYSQDRKLRGVRHVVQDEPDDEFMMRKDFLRGIAALSHYGLAYDILIYPKHIRCAARLVQKFPGQRFVVDHIAKPLIRKHELEPWKSDMQELARHENVWCKLSGMVTEADPRNWKPADFLPYMDAVLEMYGPRRLMFGSDWPVCTVAARYGEVFAIVRDFIGGLSSAEQERIMGRTAADFYGLDRL
jgi:L-fuconolactonase